MLESHYAPKAKVRLMDAQGLQASLDLLGNSLPANGGDGAPPRPTIATYARAVLSTPSPQVLRRRMPDDAAATAQQLFAVLREFDEHGVKLIWVETPPDTPEWEGVRDRLQRAAA
jgi:L-threonylcarbamoyladenylate synthase